MSYLIIALLGITVTQPNILDQTDEEWTALGYRVIEEVSINPLDYGEPIGWGENCNGPTASIGCQAFFVPTDNGEKWRIVMLLKDKLVILQEDEEPRDIPLAFSSSPRGIIYSRNGKYALIMGPVLDSSREAIYSREADIVDIETGEISTFEPLQSTGWTGFQFVNDDGSIFRWDNRDPYRLLEYYDSNLNLMSSTEIPIGVFTHYGHASGGSLMLFGTWDLLSAYDNTGTLLWNIELERGLPGSPFASADGSVVLLAKMDGLECRSGLTGELLWEEFETQMNAPVPSADGSGWAVQIVHQGLAFGSDFQSRNSVNTVYYPADAWAEGVPVVVSRNGCSLLDSVSRPPTYQNYNLIKVMYMDNKGRVLWVSAPFSVASSPLDIHSPNNNIENELSGGAYSIQSDGERFIYSDYNIVRIMRVEGGSEE